MRKTIDVREQTSTRFCFFKSERGRALAALLTALLAIVAWGDFSAKALAQETSPAIRILVDDKSVTVQSEVERRTSAAAAALVTEFEVNGLKVLLKRREGSQTVAGGLFIRGGSRNLTAANAGIETLMLDLASEASINYPRARMRSELSRMGTVISSSENYDYSVLAFTTTRPNFDRSWEIFADVALRPAFTKEDFDLVKNRHLSQLRDDSDDPDTYLQRLQERVAYAGHPYLNRPQGTVESVSSLTLEDVKRYHKQMLETSRLLLVIVGDLNANELRARLAAAFGKLPQGAYRPQPVPPLSFSAASVEVTQRGLPTNYVQGLFTAPSLSASDIYPMQVASSMLRDRVFEEVRVKRNLSYAPSAFLGSQAANIGGIYVSAVDANLAVSVMLNEIKRLQVQPLNATDISGVVSQYLTGYYLGQETNAAQAASLAEYELNGGGWRNSFDTLSHLRTVTPADVQRVAQKYMRNIRFVVLGDPGKIDKYVFTNQGGAEARP
ncbi:MAG: zinc protease [Blastocatellia bacterium]|jgi:predicted Zn-dependent peptidase|nr:zinc protease [Blastocatellia bacterium]